MGNWYWQQIHNPLLPTPHNTNKITELNVQGLTSLKHLSCFDNNITRLNVQSLNKLEILSCGGNELARLDVKNLTKLRDFNCRENKLQSLDVSGLIALTTLQCQENQLASLNLKGCNALQELNCSVNELALLKNDELAILNVKDCTALKWLDCYQNKLDAKAMTKLLTDLPAYQGTGSANATLYTEETGKEEDNCKVFNNPETLKNAFENAKNVKHWNLQKHKGYDIVDITL